MDPIAIAIAALFLFIAGLLITFIMKGHFTQTKIEDIEALIARGRFKDALTRLEKMLENDERDPKVNFLLGLVHEKNGGFQNAILQYRRLLKFGRWKEGVTELKVRTHLAECYLHVGNHTEAKNEYLILTQIDPDNFENYYEAGLLFYRGKAFPNALRYLKHAVTLNPRHHLSWSILGRANFSLKAYAEAKEALSKAAELDPTDRENLYFLGQSHRFLGEHHSALSNFEKSERDEAYRTRSILARGLVYIDQGAYAQAMPELERGIAWAEEGSDFWLQFHYLLASCAERLKDMTTAIEHWEVINRNDPKYRDVASKLKQYAEFRTNDQIKELLIANRNQFEAMGRAIASNMGYRVNGVRQHNELLMTLICTEGESGQKMRVQSTLIRLYRDMNSVSENQLREFHDFMKAENAAKGVFITVGEFAPSTVEYAANRPFELIDGTALSSLLQGVTF
ncbi:MAG: tetratricopeptide repeat protein [Leptonema sp. (in: Bacteria)]|nr:tetratricopeptide repeat protein [Leptonema sp. (in: bacteria)]